MQASCGLVVLAAACAIGLNSIAAAEPITVRDAFDRAVYHMDAGTRRLLGRAGAVRFREPHEKVGLEPPGASTRAALAGIATVDRRDLSFGSLPRVVVTPARQAAHQLVDPMVRIGIPTIVLMQRSVTEILANIRLLGRVAGVSDRGEEVAGRLEARLASTMQRVKGRTLPRVVMITGRLGNGLLLVTRPGTYTGDAIELAGGRFALEGRGVIAQVSPEAIMSADPDVLLYAGSPADRDELIKRPGWSEMRAVTTKRAYAVSRVELLIPGPRTIDGIEHLAALLHPATSPQ